MMGRAIAAMFGSPWLAVALVAALTASHGAAYLYGRADAAAHAEVKRLELLADQRAAAIARLSAQMDENRATARRANERAVAARAKLTELETRADALQAEFDARVDLCVISDDDARRLRNLK